MSVATTSAASMGNAGSAAAFDDMTVGTILTLVKLTSVAAGMTRLHFASKLGAVAGGFEFHQRQLDGVSFRYASWKAGSQAAAISTGVLTAGTWTWCGVSWDTNGAGTMLANLWHGTGASNPTISDVTSSVSGSGALDSDAAYDLRFACNHTGTSAMDGEIAEMLLFNVRVTTASDVQAMIAGTYGTAPIGRWAPGYDGSGAMSLDRSGNNNPATLTSVTPTLEPRVPYARPRLALMGVG